MLEVTSPDERLLLALLNTTPTIGGERTDLLAHPRQARSWLEEHTDEQHTEEDLTLLRTTRDTLQALVHNESEPTALTPALADVSYRPIATNTGITWKLTTPPAHALSARAVIAWNTIQNTSPGRLRPCENTTECTLFLIDHSKSNSARWCSMAGCGNRMKARRHYERRKKSTS
ncbi:CGNR zinc finger domain-containing protein [Nocardia miyunensis]|uniref:CGNR zinc finger domain-containing protein n=1 Tax=Nocardia miyunensis TaxID=282684 RepID=UPI00082F81C7|nr:CGNR zinc finger domain-containing protein [Nocardia miyunensis]